MMSDPARVDPFGGDLDLSDFKPAPAKKPPVQRTRSAKYPRPIIFPAARRSAPGLQNMSSSAGVARAAMSSSTSRPRPKRSRASPRSRTSTVLCSGSFSIAPLMRSKGQGATPNLLAAAAPAAGRFRMAHAPRVRDRHRMAGRNGFRERHKAPRVEPAGRRRPLQSG